MKKYLFFLFDNDYWINLFYNEARIPKQAASISPASLRSEASPLGKRQEEVLPMAKLEQRRYNLYKFTTGFFSGTKSSTINEPARSSRGRETLPGLSTVMPAISVYSATWV